MIDQDVYRSLKYFRDSDLNEHQDYLQQYFVYSNPSGEERELKPNGASILVTNENKEEFIRLKCHYYLHKQVSMQLKEIKRGFNSVIYSDWVSFFTPA